MNVIKNNEIDKTQWYNFVKDHPKGNLFQTPDMYDVYQKTPGYTPQRNESYTHTKTQI